MRAMAVDFGFKQIGIAVGEVPQAISSSRPAILASGTLKKDAVAIANLAKKEEVSLVVVGVPVEESGEEGRMARICRTLGGHISDAGIPVAFVDESYTSREAQALLSESGVKVQRQKELIHGESAMLILERYALEAPTQ